jgi:hypothetical protein
MARWYGFRQEYDDLIRLWTTDWIARCFFELSLVEESLRDSIFSLTRAGLQPAQMAIKLRAHSALSLTSRAKSKTAVLLKGSWSGGHPQTILLPLSSPQIMANNLSLTEELIGHLSPWTPCPGGVMARDVPAQTVISFLRRYYTHPDSIVFRADMLSDWLEERNTFDEVLYWSIFISSPAQGRPATLAGQEVGLTKRKRTSSEGVHVLLSPAHEGVDLPGGPDFYKIRRSYDSSAMREARPSNQGLLLIYPLDPAYLKLEFESPVIALALSLPITSDDDSDWIVNRKVANV